jgi:deazaflavin-dependent oxidoreductase (nitroreductase family)
VRVVDAMGLSPGLFWGYAPLGIRVVPMTSLKRVDCELATMRTAWNVGSRYEWHHHVHQSRWAGGFAAETVERVTLGPDAPGWSDKQRFLLRAVDELHADRMISEATWADLSKYLTPRQVVDLCFLVGHYEMLAMALKTFGIEPEPGAYDRGLLTWLRRDDDSDRLMPRRLPRFNKLVTNRVGARLAGVIPPYALIHHVGRKSGRDYQVPVGAYFKAGQVAIGLPYGSNVDWLKNVLAAGGAEITHRRQIHKLTNPRIVDATSSDGLPLVPRVYARLMKVLVLDVAE